MKPHTKVHLASRLDYFGTSGAVIPFESTLFCHSDKSRSEEEESAFLDSLTKLPANRKFLFFATLIVEMTKIFDSNWPPAVARQASQTCVMIAPHSKDLFLNHIEDAFSGTNLPLFPTVAQRPVACRHRQFPGMDA